MVTRYQRVSDGRSYHHAFSNILNGSVLPNAFLYQSSKSIFRPLSADLMVGGSFKNWLELRPPAGDAFSARVSAWFTAEPHGRRSGL